MTTQVLTEAQLAELLAALEIQPKDKPPTLPVDCDFETIECEGGVVTQFLDDMLP